MQVKDRMRKTPVTVKPTDDIRQAARLMRKAGVEALPVVNGKGQVLGVVTAEDFADIPHLEKNHVDAIQDVQVAELMSKEVVSVEPDTTLSEAAGTMLEGGFRHLPVLDAHRRLVGILSERDLRTFLGVELGEFHKASRGSDEHVSSLMRQNPTSLLPTSSLVSALEVFSDERVGALPVMNEDDTLAGMLSYVDVMTWLSGESARVPAVSSEAEAFLPP